MTEFTNANRGATHETTCPKNLAIFILIHVMLCLYAVSDGYCQERESQFHFEYGLGLVGGMAHDDGLEFGYSAAYPMFGWLFHDRWTFDVEGNIGHYCFDSLDITSLGLQGLFAYEFHRFDRSSAFLAGGGGFLHLDVDKRPRLTDATILGLAQVGFGVRLSIDQYEALRLE